MRFFEAAIELVSKELNHLAAILHVYARGLNFMKYFFFFFFSYFSQRKWKYFYTFNHFYDLKEQNSTNLLL